MISNDRFHEEETIVLRIDTEGDDLAELVNGAVKALSIGNPLDTDAEARRAVDSLKHQLESTEAAE